ncbi:helicase-associated domain-containing protein [Actinomadura hibisca]|uniref:helicase-associated domain-containing protein n=1 Tax=Actinomadura hibisca TaxID=68565 RepID=UPI0008334AF2|nr:helicase-associated domain-containing protein [Actinomadura hibisca]
MEPLDALTGWLRECPVERLAEVIRQRPWLLEYAPPRTPRELAQRIIGDLETEVLLLDAGLPEMEVLATAARLARDRDDRDDRGIGPSPYGLPFTPGTAQVPEHELLALFGGPHGPEGAAVTAILDGLRARLLVLPATPGVVALPSAIAGALSAPLHWEPALNQALTVAYNKAEVMTVAAALGVSATTRPDAQAGIVRLLSDPERVRALLAEAPPEAARMLTDVVRQEVVLGTYCFERRGGKYVFRAGGSGDADTDWLARRGLLVPVADERAQVPKEVADVVRGEAGPVRLTLRPPEVAAVPVAEARVVGEASAALTAAADRLEALLDAVDVRPAAIRKAGGLAIRETRRIAKQIGADEDETRLWIDLCASAGLLEVGPVDGVPHLMPAHAYKQWTTEQLVPVLHAWLRHGLVLSWWPDDGERPIALVEPDDALAPVLRTALLRTLAGLPDGTGLPPGGVSDDLLDAVAWHRPLCAETDDLPGQAAATLREAELLGVVAHGALTGVGRALLEPDPADERLAEAVTALLPRPLDRARFQTDLTAVVSGPPSAKLAALLNGAADRESRGGATVWRFSEASVRRALDGGTGADALLAALRKAADGGLPQALEYMVTDVGRRHGRVRVVRTGCCLRSDDEALLTEIAAHRDLRGLSPRRIAPTVLVSAAGVDETLAALRAAGYAPALEEATGTAVVERAPSHRAPKPRKPRRKALTPEDLAERVLKAR